MINMMASTAHQLSHDGCAEDWIIKLEGEHIYTLPSHFSEQEVFLIRDIVRDMVAKAHSEMKKQEEQLCMVKINRIVENGDAKLDALREENIRISQAFEQHILSEEVT